VNKKKVLVNVIIALGVTALLSFFMVRLLRGRDLDRVDRLSSEYNKLLSKNKALKKENRLLRRSVDALRSDQRTLEMIARKEHGLVRRDEIIFQFNNSKQERAERSGREDQGKP